MDLQRLKDLLFSFLKQFDENEICLLMDYLGTLIQEYEKDYSKLFELINKQSTKTTNLFENLIHSTDHINDLERRSNLLEFIDDQDQDTSNYDDNSIGSEMISIQPNQSALDASEIKIEPTESVLSNVKVSKRLNLRKKTVKLKSQSVNLPKRQLRNSTIKMANSFKKAITQRSSENQESNEAVLNATESENEPQTETTFTNNDTLLDSNTSIGKNSLFNQSIKEYLISKFNENRYPDNEELEKILAHTKLTRYQVRNWFKDRRRKSCVIKFNSLIVKKLLKYYYENKNPKNEKIKEIARDLNLTQQQVEKWFQNKQCSTKHTVYANRIRYSDKANILLQKSFVKNNYLTGVEIRKLARQTELEPKQVSAWFRDNRRRVRKQTQNE